VEWRRELLLWRGGPASMDEEWRERERADVATIKETMKEIKELLKDLKKSNKRFRGGKDFVADTRVERVDRKESFMVIKETKEKLQDLHKSGKSSEGENSKIEDEKREETFVQDNHLEEEEEGLT